MGYLVADKVLAYDGNRGLIRGAVRGPWSEARAFSISVVVSLRGSFVWGDNDFKL